jgi:hypothetical protein
MPQVRFDSLEEEVNFLAVASLLCFGSGFRSELHASINGSVDGSGAYGTITRGVLAMYLAVIDLVLYSIVQMCRIGCISFPILREQEDSVLVRISN